MARPAISEGVQVRSRFSGCVVAYSVSRCFDPIIICLDIGMDRDGTTFRAIMVRNLALYAHNYCLDIYGYCICNRSNPLVDHPSVYQGRDQHTKCTSEKRSFNHWICECIWFSIPHVLVDHVQLGFRYKPTDWTGHSRDSHNRPTFILRSGG